MEGLLGNPVLQGLLGGGGPMGVRAQSQQQLAQMMPRGGGGMIGAPSAPAPDRSGAAAIASLGDSVANVITHRAEKSAAEEAKAQKMQALTAHIDSLDIPEEQKVRYRTLAAGNPDGMFNVLGKQLLGGGGDAAEFINVVNPTTGESSTIQKGQQPPPGFVVAGNASLDTPKPDKIKLWYGDKSVEATPGSATEKYYKSVGYTPTPTGGGVAADDDSFKNEKDLRSEVININKGFRDISSNFQRVEKSIQNPSPAGDIALVFSYMKMLDPTSVVREGEAASAQNAGGVPARIRAQYNDLIGDGKFTDSQRNDFYSVARKFYDQSAEQYQQDYNYYQGIAENYGLNPENIGRNIYVTPTRGKNNETPRAQNVATPPLLSGSRQAPVSEVAPSIPEDMATGGGQLGEWSNFIRMSPTEQVDFLESLEGDGQIPYLSGLSDSQLDALDREYNRRRAQ